MTRAAGRRTLGGVAVKRRASRVKGPVDEMRTPSIWESVVFVKSGKAPDGCDSSSAIAPLLALFNLLGPEKLLDAATQLLIGRARGGDTSARDVATIVDAARVARRARRDEDAGADVAALTRAAEAFLDKRGPIARSTGPQRRVDRALLRSCAAIVSDVLPKVTSATNHDATPIVRALLSTLLNDAIALAPAGVDPSSAQVVSDLQTRVRELVRDEKVTAEALARVTLCALGSSTRVAKQRIANASRKPLPDSPKRR